MLLSAFQEYLSYSNNCFALPPVKSRGGEGQAHVVFAALIVPPVNSRDKPELPLHDKCIQHQYGVFTKAGVPCFARLKHHAPNVSESRLKK